MGSLDFGPFDNDDASDFWYAIRYAKDPVKTLNECLNSSSGDHKNNERRAAAAFVKLLDRFDRKIMGTLKRDAQKVLKNLLDGEFPDDWRDPSKIRRILRKEIKDLK